MSTKAEFKSKNMFDFSSTEGTEEDRKSIGELGVITPRSTRNITNSDVTLHYLKTRDPMKEFFSLVIS